MRIPLSTLILLALLSFNGCGGGNSSNQGTNAEDGTIPKTMEDTLDSDAKYFSVAYPKTCSMENQTKFMYDVMHDSYLFANHVTTDVNLNNYTELDQLLNDLRYEKDRYSFFMDADTLRKFFDEGTSENFGLDFFYAPVEGQSYYYLIISYVYPNSPADKADIKRGDIITSLNGLPIYDLQEAFAMYSQEASLDLKVINYNEEGVRDITITKAEYSIKTVLDARILNEGDKKIGYLVFQNFITQAKDELDYHFGIMKEKEVDELVLDLRYNGGGDTSVANHLAALIGGENVYGKIFDRIYFNEKYSKYNYNEYFNTTNSNALNLKRVFIITSQATASSSELVINSLRASDNGVEVIQIGTTTYGKPYAFIPTTFCDQALLIVNIESKNSDGTGGYVDGIAPKCKADDDIFKAFGDTEEASLNEALYYIANGKCKPATTTLTKADKPSLKTYAVPRTGFRQIMSAY